MKKAIITGSTGFIGSAFVEFLVAKGIDVLAIGRKDLNDISKIRRKRIKAATLRNNSSPEGNPNLQKRRRTPQSIWNEFITKNLTRCSLSK